MINQPQSTLRVASSLRAALKVTAALQGRKLYEVVNEAIAAYLKTVKRRKS